MDKKLVRAFVQECIDVQDWEARQKANHIEMNDWFKYSGKVEQNKEMYRFASSRNKWVYDSNNRCYTLHEIITKKTKKDEKNKNNTSGFVEADETGTWKTTNNRL